MPIVSGGSGGGIVGFLFSLCMFFFMLAQPSFKLGVHKVEHPLANDHLIEPSLIPIDKIKVRPIKCNKCSTAGQFYTAVLSAVS